jgi:hypothetical protein
MVKSAPTLLDRGNKSMYLAVSNRSFECAYQDVDNLAAWIWLERCLKPGHDLGIHRSALRFGRLRNSIAHASIHANLEALDSVTRVFAAIPHVRMMPN